MTLSSSTDGGTGLDASDLSYKLSADGDFFIMSSGVLSYK